MQRQNASRSWRVLAAMAAWCIASAAFAEVKSFAARDTLAARPDAVADAQAMLDDLAWEPGGFEVACGPDERWGSDALVRFDSPRPTGDAVNDRACLMWYAARGADGAVLEAPAVVVVHESASGMTVGRMIGAGLASRGVHAFVLQLPGYGERRSPESQNPEHLAARLVQGVADVRRARDAVNALPNVQRDRIALQGTSLGGFVAASVAGIDDAFEAVWVMVAGGRIDLALTTGDRDAAKIRQRIEDAGIDGPRMLAMFRRVEPTRLAHRIAPGRLFMVTAAADTVIPRACADALASTAGLTDEQHLVVPGDHYTAFVALPGMLDRMAQTMQAR